MQSRSLTEATAITGGLLQQDSDTVLGKDFSIVVAAIRGSLLQKQVSDVCTYMCLPSIGASIGEGFVLIVGKMLALDMIPFIQVCSQNYKNY